MWIYVCVLISCLCCACDGKQFQTNCDLVQELRRQDFPEDKMQDWVCLINAESLRQTNIIGPMNKDGSRDYGLFQINDKWWCINGSKPGKDCNVTCADLLTDDITKASICAKVIYRRHKFYAWNGWRNYCQTGLPDISNC